MQISESKESDTLLLAVVSHRENVAAVHRRSQERHKRAPRYAFSVCVCVRACAQGHTCVLSRVRMCVSAQGTKEQNKPEVA